VAHAAHLGGLLFGWFWVQAGYHRGEGLWERLSEGWQRWNQQRQTRRALAGSVQGRILKPSFRSDSAQAPNPAKELSDAEFIAREVDPILEKIARDGIASLNAAERQTLEAARQKVTRR
jgi:hypothetical protein